MASIAFAAPFRTPQPIIITDVPREYPAEEVAIAAPSIEVVLKEPLTKKKNEDCSAYLPLISGYDWPIETAMQICRDESHGNPKEINWDDKHRNRAGEIICISSQGLFQVGCFWPEELGYTMDDLLIPERNVAMAYQIWAESGFGPWTTYTP